MISALRKILPKGVITVECTDFSTAEALHPEEEPIVAKALTKRRREFTAGRACARQALEQLGFGAQPVLSRARAPVWPGGAVGSITHTNAYAAAAVGRRGDLVGLGIDAECKDRVRRCLWPQIAGREEIDWLERQGREAEVRAAILFSAKEAFYKAQYCVSRAWVGFHDVVLRMSGEAFEIELVQDIAGLAARGTRYEGRCAQSEVHVLTSLAISCSGSR